MVTFERCLTELVNLSKSEKFVTNAEVDDLVDSYLIGFAKQTTEKRAELAHSFKELAGVSKLSEAIWERILRLI